jgi:prolyl oligopeptidase
MQPSRVALALALALAGSLAGAAGPPPPTPKKPVTDTYNGVQVVDDYRWLENYSDPAVRQWSDRQNQYARGYLDRLPARAALYDELKRLYTHPSPGYFALTSRPGLLFALKSEPPKEQELLVTLASPDDTASEHVILDPNQLDSTGGTSVDFYEPSTNGKYVAVSLSQGGSESGDVHVYSVETGKPLDDIVPRVNGGTAGGSVAWNADDSGFYYTRYPRGTERPPADLSFYQQVYFHRLGTPTTQDTYSLGKDFPRIAEIALHASSDGRYILAAMAYGDGGEFAHYLLRPDGKWRQITLLSDEVSRVAFGMDESLYLLSRHNAPLGAILRMPLDPARLADARTVVPEGRHAIEDFVPCEGLLYVADMIGGPSQIRVFDLTGHFQSMAPLDPLSSVGQMVRYNRADLLFRTSSYLKPPAWMRFDAGSKRADRTALFETAPADFHDAEVVREFAVSKDGTKVPVNIIRRKGAKLDGSNPVVLYGYGGYGINMSPFFSLRLRALLDRGVVYAIANLRGGAEYGEAWHRAGMLTKKQNVFDDFAAAARHLIERRYTTSARLAIEGGSNGGLLMGAALTQHPELYRAVVSYVGIYDMLRVELYPNGAFNITEFGTVKEPEQFRALYAYSPYHHVVDGTQYPSVLFLTGANDPRVDPANSRKMTARLQATASKNPVLLRTTSNAGHGIGTALSEEIAQDADVLAFLFDQLDIREH